MNILFVLVPLSLLLLVLAIAAFVWAVRSGQFDDLDTPATRFLLDEEIEDERRERKAAERDA